MLVGLFAQEISETIVVEKIAIRKAANPKDMI
jgi:hypothetical protein